MRVRSGEVFFMAVLMIIILLAMFVLVALAMMISQDESLIVERKGAVFQLVDQITSSLYPLMDVLARITEFLIEQFWQFFPA